MWCISWDPSQKEKKNKKKCSCKSHLALPASFLASKTHTLWILGNRKKWCAYVCTVVRYKSLNLPRQTCIIVRNKSSLAAFPFSLALVCNLPLQIRICKPGFAPWNLEEKKIMMPSVEKLWTEWCLTRYPGLVRCIRKNAQRILECFFFPRSRPLSIVCPVSDGIKHQIRKVTKEQSRRKGVR